MPYEVGPFAQTPPESIHLVKAPLPRVLCQVRWPELTVLIRDFESAAQNIGASLADDYPLFAVRQEANIVIGPGGVSQGGGVPVYQWSTANGQVHVHFSHTFLTVETTQYTSKEDLIGRIGKVLEILSENIAIPVCNRLGYRYTNRMLADIDIRPLIREEVRGAAAIPTRDGVDVIQSVTETLYRVDEDHLLVRWAQLPANAVIDPTLPPVPLESWLLDLDAYHDAHMPFVPAELTSLAFRLAGRGYTFFRSSITAEFLETFGGADGAN